MKGQGTYNFNPIHANYVLAYKFQDNTDNPYGIMELNKGGNFNYTSSYLTSGFGPVTDFSGNGLTPLSITNTFVEDSNIQIDNTYFLPSFENYAATPLERQEYSNIIKKQIMDNGGVYFHVAAPKGVYYNATYDSVYTDNAVDYINAAHAMIIIGWDDNYSRTKFNPGRNSGQIPTTNGAWIVQNSWGTASGDNGYYYYSYEDYMIGGYMAGIISASPVDYDNIYQYNPTGSTNQISGNYGAVIFNKDDLKTESLTEISFNIYQPNTSYEIYVNAIDGSLTGDNVKLVQSSTVPVEYPGYHTVDLDNPVLLKGKE
jgi:C1A family cysteine protease